ncbi:MAG: thiamine-phosphate kinase [Phycisphaerales bacterium]|nr:thiamine-monophosphate kinase [Planctomycetota bacterium]MCH8509227.1 thiamine-phosphate kinase [Phycisphaerales bacterium]
MRESQLHEHIYARSAGLALGAGWRPLVGPGDDCAVLETPGGGIILVTVDQLVEGRHFEPGTDIDRIARKAVARSVSDIAAMGGSPAWALGTGLLPKGYPHADALFEAMARWARHWNCPLIGGDIASHGHPDHPLTLTVTVAGSVPDGHRPVLRSGARPGDRLWLTGPVGDALASGRHLTFEPRIEQGLAAARQGSGVTAMIDLSDGLGRDADRVARASNAVLEIDADAIPLHPGTPGWRAGAGGGEDHELLIAAEEKPDIPGLLGPIGRVRAPGPGEAPGAMILDAGTTHPAGELGWDH